MTISPTATFERRRHPRFPVEVGAIVGFSHNGNGLEGVIVDLSMGGLQLRFTEPLPKIEGIFTIAHGLAGPLQVHQTWVRGTTMGVSFDMPEDSALSRELRCVQLLLDNPSIDDADQTSLSGQQPG
ncbi:MAG: PilZ domain-containing protein [Kiloniellales bacterium]|nr:PilZ domain-containing protein [Kiloniellales bacterium]